MPAWVLISGGQVLRETQPTLGRQITKLEEDLGTVLFERLGRTLSLTQAGHDVHAHFQAMAQAAGDVHLAATRVTKSIEGTVTVTATNFLASHILPHAMREVRALAPKLQIEIHASNDVQDLKQREADIAIRYARPTENEVIGKRISDTRAHLFGSQKYLNEFGPIADMKDLEGVSFIGAPDFETYGPILKGHGFSHY